MAKITPEQLADLRAKHGSVHVLSTPRLPGEDFVFRPAGAGEFDAFLATVASRDLATKSQAHRQLAVDLLVYPSEGEWREMAAKLPGLAHTIGDHLSKLAGLDADIVVGKG